MVVDRSQQSTHGLGTTGRVAPADGSSASVVLATDGSSETLSSEIEVHSPAQIYSRIKRFQRQSWEAGDYQVIAAQFTIIAELLCESLELRAGQEVLDVATGTGNTALAAARRRCRVKGVDFAPCLLRRALDRAEAEGLQVHFVAGDAEDLPFADASFDAVVSTLGAMFAPNQKKAAAELVRVCRPGGKIGMVNWTTDGWAAQVSSIIGSFVPAPPVLKAVPRKLVGSPFDWGCADRIQKLLGRQVTVTLNRRSYLARHSSASAYWEHFRAASGSAKGLYERLSPSNQEELTRQVVELTDRLNQSNDDTLVVPQDYIEVIAVKQKRPERPHYL